MATAEFRVQRRRKLYSLPGQYRLIDFYLSTLSRIDSNIRSDWLEARLDLPPGLIPGPGLAHGLLISRVLRSDSGATFKPDRLGKLKAISHHDPTLKWSLTYRFPLLGIEQRQPAYRKYLSALIRSMNNRKVRRRRSSGLGADIRGDTSAPAVSTVEPPPPSPLTTTDSKMLKSSFALQRNSARSGDRRRGGPLSRQRRKVRTLFRRWRALSFKHTWVNPLVILLVVISGYLLNPTESNPLHSAIFLSYAEPLDAAAAAAGIRRQYGKGLHDLAFVAFYIVVLSFTREFLMQILLRPLTVRWGIRGRAKQARFMEQSYTAIYFAVFGPYGLYVMANTPMWYFNTTAFFVDFPHRTHDAAFKAYYLLEAAYWAQQAIVLLLQLEKPRKDFKELVWHHIITLVLIASSYRFHFTYMGLAVYITHDISDFFLATSKCLNYLDSPIVGPYFGLFVGVWVYLRHYINLRILYSILTDFRTVGPYKLDWAGGQFKCWISQAISFALLASLQAVNLFWLFLILRIARNYVFSKELGDDRSDDEEEEEDREEDVEEKRKTGSDQKKSLNGKLTGGHVDGEDDDSDDDDDDGQGETEEKPRANGSAVVVGVDGKLAVPNDSARAHSAQTAAAASNLKMTAAAASATPAPTATAEPKTTKTNGRPNGSEKKSL
ncbi:MAG: hypothetical protein M1825_002743 [Sarcosagium campestre]|nr:MAG: hypothetical protein M1825_002743 [Sarcosagium campestre]